MAEGMYRCSKFMQHDFIMRSKMSVIKSKMGRKFEQKRKAKWVKEKANLVKAYLWHFYTCIYYTLASTICNILPV